MATIVPPLRLRSSGPESCGKILMAWQLGILKRTSTDEAVEEAVVAGRLAGSRLAAGRLVLDRLGHLYDLFASLVNVENTYVRKFTLRVSP